MHIHIIPRKHASRVGMVRYFTGKPCGRGHISERQVVNGACLECSAENSAAFRERDPDRAKAIDRRFKETNREVLAQRRREAYAADPERFRAISKNYADRNKDKLVERRKEYSKRAVEVIRAAGRRKRARKRDAEGNHTAADIAALKVRQRMKCATCRCCLKSSGHHVDHIEPLARGGSNWPWNLQLLCPTCNMKKNAKDPIQWASENGFLL